MRLERQIYDMETRYLEDSALLGNIVLGYEGYSDTRISLNQRRGFNNPGVSSRDRVFSNSSCTAPPIVESLGMDADLFGQTAVDYLAGPSAVGGEYAGEEEGCVAGPRRCTCTRTI